MTTPEQHEFEPVLFFREEGFYPVEHMKGKPYEEHALLNPGTLLITDPLGKVLWSATPEDIAVGSSLWETAHDNDNKVKQ